MQTGPSLQAGSATGRRALGLIFLIVFIDLLGFAIVLPLLPRYAERFQASDAVIGLLFAAFSGMQFIFAPLWGRLSDRWGRRPALLAGLAGSVIFYSLFGVATIAESLTLMFVARIGAGICGATISAAQAYIADVTGPQERARGMALIGAAFGMGFTFGPIIGSMALPHTPTPGMPEPLNALPGFLAAGLSLVALLLAAVRLPESLHTSLAPTRHYWLDVKALRSALSVPSIGMLVGLFFLTTFAFGQFETTLSRLTEKVFSLGDRDNFRLFIYIGATLCLAQAVVVRQLAPRLGEAVMVTLGTALTVTGLYLMNLAAEHRSMTAFVVIMPVVICGLAFVTTCVQSLISRRSDPAQQGGILGLNQSAAAMARILSPITANILFGHGPLLPYQTSAMLLVPAFVIALIAGATGRDWPSTITPAVEPDAD